MAQRTSSQKQGLFFKEHFSREHEVPNTDRLSCVRQDDLDLVKPPREENAIRMVLGINEKDTANDVLLSVDSLWLKRVSLIVNLKRQAGSDGFVLEVEGEDQAEKGDHLGLVDFWINGVDILVRNSWMDWGADMVADRDLLNKGQNGRLLFKLYGEGHAVFNEESRQWDVAIKNKTTKFFSVEIDHQWVLQKMLNKFGGLDALIMDSLWSFLDKAVPRSFAASMLYLNQTELMAEMHARFSGQQEDDSQPLHMDVKMEFNSTGQPDRVLATFIKEFDPARRAQETMNYLLDSHNLTEMWAENEAGLAEMLKRYGVKLDSLAGELDLDEVRRQILDWTKVQADFLMKAMRPFIKASKTGIDNFWDGLHLNLEAETEWDIARKGGLMDTYVRAAPDADGQRRKYLEVPDKFMEAVRTGMEEAGATALVVPPKPGRPDATIQHDHLEYKDGLLKCGSLGFHDLRFRSGGINGTKTEVWKIGGNILDTSMLVPPSFRPDIALEWPVSDIRLNSEGDLSFDIGDEGIQVHQTTPQKEAPLPANPAKQRVGKAWDWDGPLPANVSRPVQWAPAPTKTEVMPRQKTSMKIAAAGTPRRVTTSVVLEGSLSVEIDGALKPTLAPRPQEDFGYVFHVGRFKRWLRSGEAGLANLTDVVVVVNCGYLRILSRNHTDIVEAAEEEEEGKEKKDPLAVLDFRPITGQLELQLEQYHSGSPEVSVETVPGVGAQHCLNLYSGGYPPRRVNDGYIFRGDIEADDRLCGPEGAVRELRQAIGLQIQRFHHDEDTVLMWNYGTHRSHDEEGQELPQYQLAPGRETKPLMDLVALAWKGA